MMKSILCLLLVLASSGVAPARTLVFPFAVDEAGQTAHRWLGKAFSYYLAAGLRLNGLDSLSEEESQLLLERHSIRFPFSITKASSITLARQNGVDTVILGTILFSEPSRASITAKMSLIDVANGRQRHLPLLRARSVDVFKLQAELLRETLKALGRQPESIQLPELGLSLVDYERFIKGLLVSDPEKKAELLQPQIAGGARSDFADFELAKVRLAQGQAGQARALLERIGDAGLLAPGKRFLLALAEWFDQHPESALAQFDQLQRDGVFPVETQNNLGVIHLQRGDWTSAQTCFRAALALRPEPNIFLNEVLLLRKNGQPAAASAELNRALEQFPEDAGLLRLFSRSLGESENRGMLENAFRSYLLTLPLRDDEPDPAPRPLNPFAPAPAPVTGSEAKSIFLEARSLFLEGDLEGALSKVQEALEINPFLADSHQLLALVYLQKKLFSASEMFARSALFLQESPGNYLLLVKVLGAGKQEEARRDALKRALEKFPADPELQALGVRGG